MAYAPATRDTADQIVLRLEDTDPAAVGVRAIDLCVSSVKVRFVSGETNALDDVFQPDIGRIVRSICDAAAHATGVIERPEFRLRLRGLSIEGYRLAVSTGPTGVRRLDLSFSRATGNALAIFRLSARPDTGLALFTPRILSEPEDKLNAERLFDEMLSQLYLPLVNLNAYLRHVLDGSVAEKGASFSNSVVQLKTRAETLQFAFDRLIAEMMVDKYAGMPGAQLVDSTAA